jgi:hypothetical protein
MDSQQDEFPGWSIEKVQADFFLGDLLLQSDPGCYAYRTQGLDAEPGTVVLFQFTSQIIANAVLLRTERYEQADGPYKGALWFDPNSIQVFKPVGTDVVRKHWPEFTGFSQVKWNLISSRYPAFEHELLGIQRPAPPVPQAPQSHDLQAPMRVQTTVSRILRDTQLTNRVKMLHNYECQICGHTLILANGSRYAEGHHIQPLGVPHNGPDVIENIVCLCPNHHAACDLGAIRLDPNELRQRAGHCLSQRYIDYHNKTIWQGTQA